MKIKEFKKFTKAHGKKLGVDWYGYYEGRFWHKGIAVSSDSEYAMAQFVSKMNEHGISLGAWNHTDQLGYGKIYSWTRSKFDDEKGVA